MATTIPTNTIKMVVALQQKQSLVILTPYPNSNLQCCTIFNQLLLLNSIALSTYYTNFSFCLSSNVCINYFFWKNHVRKKVKCFCCDNDDILRDIEIIKHFKLCDYWYCSECIIQTDDNLNTLQQIKECTEFETRWIVQIYSNDDKQWKSAKIKSIQLKQPQEANSGIAEFEHNQMDIVYFENDKADTLIFEEDSDFILRFVTNSKADKMCKVFLVCFLFFSFFSLNASA